VYFLLLLLKITKKVSSESLFKEDMVHSRDILEGRKEDWIALGGKQCMIMLVNVSVLYMSICEVI